MINQRIRIVIIDHLADGIDSRFRLPPGFSGGGNDSGKRVAQVYDVEAIGPFDTDGLRFQILFYRLQYFLRLERFDDVAASA